MQAFAARTGLTLVAPEVDEMCDQWMQDTIEPGRFRVPDRRGQQSGSRLPERDPQTVGPCGGEP